MVVPILGISWEMSDKIITYMKNPYFYIFSVSVFISVPATIWVFPDFEDLHTTILSTFSFTESLWAGEYPFWNAYLGFGTPLPLSNSLFPHPLSVFFWPETLWFMFGMFIFVQIFIATSCIYLSIRRMGAATFPAGIGAVSYAMCAATTYPIFIKFIPVYVLSWTLIPCIIYLIILISEEKYWSLSSFFKSLLLGAITGLFLLTGHIGTTSGFSVPVILFSAVIVVKNPRILPFLLFASLVALIISVDKLYLLWTEVQLSISVIPEQARVIVNEDFGYFSFWSLFYKPFVPTFSLTEFILRNVRFGGVSEPIWRELLFFGPPFVVLALTATVIRYRIRLWYWAILSVVVFSLAMMFVPISVYEYQRVITGNIFFVPNFILFSILLASLTLDEISRRKQGRTRLFYQFIGVLQVACLILGVLPNMVAGVKVAWWLGHVEVLQGAKPYADYLKANRSFVTSRVYLSPDVESHGPRSIANWAGEANNVLSILKVAQLQGYFKPTAMEAFEPDNNLGASQVHGSANVLLNKGLLDAFGVEFILCFEDEKWAPGLQVIQGLSPELNYVSSGGKKLLLLRNPDALPLAYALDKEASDIDLPIRLNCGHNGLMCRDYSDVVGTSDASVVDEISVTPAGKIRITLTKRETETVLLVTQLYRDGWSGMTDTGVPLEIQQAFGGFLEVKVPASTREIEISYKPELRMLLVAVQNFFWFGGVLCLVLMVFSRRIRMQLKGAFALPKEEVSEAVLGPSLVSVLSNRQAQKVTLFWFLVGFGGYALGVGAYKAMLSVAGNLIWAESVFFLIITLTFGVALQRIWKGLSAQAR